ncbi:MAG: hypothetical protein LQ343_006055 [Gyalolechia ehrenbergii]|nr:MAG: hypothetical protein LQ343_006055 [Gyalolechia ehrenbergii]
MAQTQKESSIGRRGKVAEPKYLCFLEAGGGVEQRKVSEWTESNQRTTAADYVFVSFWGGHFPPEDHPYLRDVGAHAARTIGVTAYWCSTSCVKRIFGKGEVPTKKDEEELERETEESVWNMSDIIRRARALVIAVPGPVDSQFNGESLREWGDRCWTMPELLLYTGSHPIFIYEKTKGLGGRRQIPRRELWNKVWSDTAYSGQLIDHYEGSLILTPLELTTVALHCLQNRYTSSLYLDGDVAYMLMGLLRQRPQIVRSDNEFQAFARLSLANDSNLLLERMICLLPNNLDAEWWSLEDAWDAKLWDIYPKTQICGVGEGDTVILDGAHGAAIRWDKFLPVQTLEQETLRHKLMRFILRIMPGFLLPGFLWTILSATFPKSGNALLAIGGILLGLSAFVVMLSPILLRLIYCTPTHHSQPFLFGIEGYVDRYQLELLIFGTYEGRLNWSVASSPLSRHSLDRNGKRKGLPSLDEEFMIGQNMCIGLDPVKSDTKVSALVEEAKKRPLHEKKIFTLVDTYTMTITLFEAVRPPVAVIMCGAERGMHRALLCSEDWKTGTLYRETVLRMETRVWDKMDPVSRIRLGIERNDTRGAISETLLP